MANVPTCDWIGASGTHYPHWIYELPASFNEGDEGNYVYAKKNAEGEWVPIYIGEGQLNDRANNHHQAVCIRSKGATHFHCHLNASKQARLAEEEDLLKGYPDAYQPNGCNERRGG